MLRVCLFLFLAPVAMAQTPLNLPVGAVETSRQVVDPGTYPMPEGPYTAEKRPSRQLEGRVFTQTWRVPPERGNTLAIIQTLREQFEAEGFDITFECETRTCGGFDFRFAIPVVPPPAFEVTLGDFRFLSARHEEQGLDVSLLVSRSPRGGFVQLTEIRDSEAKPYPLAPAPSVSALTSESLSEALLRQGRVVLEGVAFASGESQLDDDAVGALQPLAEFLASQPELEVLIVGHTDMEGSLEGNIRISRARARAVRNALIGTFGISPDRIGAEGAGFLSPRASNATDEGRALNRRVEVVVR